jgi:hypothetical protein
MPRDKRLYMTFPIDFHRHPKLLRLPVEVRWTFVEMNGEARIAQNDGVFQADEAEFMWPVSHLNALCTSHPSRPLVIRTETAYVIRDYAEHQLTNDDRERMAEVSRSNGAKGGRPRKNPDETQTKPSRVRNETQTKPGQTQPFAESESKSESEIETDPLTDMGTDTQSSHEPYATGSGPDLFDDITLQKAQRVGIKDLPTVLTRLRSVIDGPLSPNGGVELAWVIVDKAKHQPVKNVDAYVATACRNTPDDVRHYYDTCDLGVA